MMKRSTSTVVPVEMRRSPLGSPSAVVDIKRSPLGSPSAVVESGIAKRKPWSKRSLVKLLLMVITSTIVLCFQINRPDVTHTYSTRDPSDTVRRGVHYTCGCTLPPSLQSPENSPNLSTGSTMYRCYESSDLESVSILMYSNFTGPGFQKLEQILENINSNRPSALTPIPGLHVMSEAHSVSWSSEAVHQTFINKLPELYLGGYKQTELAIPHQQLQDRRTYLDFPTSYVGMSFVFTCKNCSSCPLDKVNSIFRNISGKLVNQTWGDCYYWGLENECTLNNTYQAKCQMYPILGIPLMLAIQRFLGDFQNMTGLNVTEITPPWDTKSPGNASLDANVLYMNLSRVQDGDVELTFSEVEKGSSTWLQLVDLFPSVDTECSELDEVKVCTGTSLCNVFQGGLDITDSSLKCLNMTDWAKCLSYMRDPPGNIYLEDHANLQWGEFNLSHDRKSQSHRPYDPTRRDWENLMCMNQTCTSKSPFLVQRRTNPAVQNSSLNSFLETKILADSWAQASGICTKTYPDVYRYPPSGENASVSMMCDNPSSSNQTMYLETHCSQNSSTSGAQGSKYCWLTGRYRQLTDVPTPENWHQLNTTWNSSTSTSEDLFWCYNVKKQNFVFWFITTFGVLFGWLGTIDLVLKWMTVLLAKLFPRPGAGGLRRGPSGE